MNDENVEEIAESWTAFLLVRRTAQLCLIWSL
jgi:hypothetical protein